MTTYCPITQYHPIYLLAVLLPVRHPGHLQISSAISLSVCNITYMSKMKFRFKAYSNTGLPTIFRNDPLFLLEKLSRSLCLMS